MIATVLCGLVGAAILHMFYGVVKTNWPASYYSIGDSTTYRISRSPLRYSLFRFVPVAVVALLAAVYSGNAVNGLPLGAVAITGGVHIATTSGRAIWDLARRDQIRSFARGSLVISHCIVLGGCIVACLVGLVAAELPSLRSVVPTASAVSGELFSAAIGGLIAAYLVSISLTPGGQSRDTMLRASRAQIGDELWELAKKESAEGGAEFRLVGAIMLTENLQRPAWIRRLERAKGRLAPAGTYGIMQTSYHRPVSDEESIKLGVRRLAGEVVRRTDGYPAWEHVGSLLEKHNRGTIFVAMATEAYMNVLQDDGSLSPEYH